MVLSLFLPLLKINFWLPVTETNQAIRVLQAVSVGDEYMSNIVITAHKNNWSFEQLYTLIYWLVSITFFLVMLRTIFLIRTLLKKYPVQQVEDVSFVNTEDDSTPFSFLHYIFWNSNIDMGTTTGRQIFKHELAHIQEKHTHDKLFVNIILIFCWCNPFFWLYRKELYMIHEFIADKKAVEDSDTAAFAAMILQAAYPKHRFELVNNFFFSPIKRRLMMLTKMDNPKLNYIARLMVLPFAVLVFAAFTFKTKPVKENFSATVESKKASKNISVPANKVSVIGESKIYTKIKDTVPDNAPINPEKALLIINGKIIGKGKKAEEGNKLLVGQSVSIKWLKRSEAIAKYGNEGADGACEINYNEGAVFTTTFTDADKMSVFYIGIDNPFTVTVQNVKPEDLVVNMSQGTRSGSMGNYVARVTSIGELTITVSKRDGTKIPASFTVKVKRVPDPTDPDFPPEFRKNLTYSTPKIKYTDGEAKIFIGNLKGGAISLDYLKSQKELTVSTGYSFVSATLHIAFNNYDNKVTMVNLISKSLLPIENLINSCVSGGSIMFDKVYVKDNNGEVKMVLNPPGFAIVDKNFTEMQKSNPQNNDEKIVFTKAEVNPQFTGGQEAWKKFLQANLKVNTPVDNGAKAGTYKVVLKFIVNTDGSLSDIKYENDPGFGTCAEAIRFIKTTPKWQPAVQNGKKVNAYLKQPITFVVEDAEGTSKAEIYKVPLKVHMMNENEVKTYQMIGNGEFAVSPGVLYYLNGKVTDDPKSILKIDVLYMESYDPGSGKKYFGEKGKNGVLILKTKS